MCVLSCCGWNVNGPMGIKSWRILVSSEAQWCQRTCSGCGVITSEPSRILGVCKTFIHRWKTPFLRSRTQWGKDVAWDLPLPVQSWSHESIQAPSDTSRERTQQKCGKPPGASWWQELLPLPTVQVQKSQQFSCHSWCSPPRSALVSCFISCIQKHRDSWHQGRTGQRLATVAALPGERIYCIVSWVKSRNIYETYIYIYIYLFIDGRNM